MPLITTFWDTFSSKRHSHDFVYARADYFRTRVGVIALIFLILTPFWALFDFFVLAENTRWLVIPARIIMTVGLIVTMVIALKTRKGTTHIFVATGLLFILPILFYLTVVIATSQEPPSDLPGYDFMPYMLTAMLAIFPLTLLEGLVLGLLFFLSQVYALHTDHVLLSVHGLQTLWLLGAILVITVTSSYFHLGLLLRLYREATHDGLTGLLNRMAFIQAVEQVMATHRRESIVFMMLDLDHFKRLNDNYGHSVGDKVLQQFARIMRKEVRSIDYVARYGGEEFVIVLVGQSKDEAMAVAERIRASTESTIMQDHEGQEFNFTVSIGVASLEANESIAQAMRRADDGLYEAKRISRNCVVGV